MLLFQKVKVVSCSSCEYVEDGELKNATERKEATPVKKANTKEVVFLDEEKNSSSSSDDDDNSGIDELVKGANDSSEEMADFAAALPIQESMSPMDEESDHPNDKEEIESRDDSDSESNDLESKPLSDYDLSDAENYFNRQNGAIICRRCGQAGHRGVDCPNVQLLDPCFQCAQTDHLARDCPMIICRQ